MIPVVDNRPSSEDCRLRTLRPGATFLWNEYLCVVVDAKGAPGAHAKDDNHILCLAIGSAQLVDIGVSAQVTPCECEIDIIA